MEKPEVMVGREFLEAVKLFDEEVSPQIKKLKYLTAIADSGIIGEDHNWTDEFYSCLSSGLFHILDEIVDRLDDYEKQLYELHGLERERTKKGEIIDPQGALGPGKEKEGRSDIIEMLEDMLEKEKELLKQEKAPEQPTKDDPGA